MKACPVLGRPSSGIAPIVAKILRSPAVIGTMVPCTVNYHPETGKRRYDPQEEVPDYYPAVISKELFEKVRRMVATRNPQRGDIPVWRCAT